MPIYDTITLDANGRPIYGPLQPFMTKKTVTFAGGTENDMGDFNGTGNPATLFNITGLVMVGIVFAVGKVDLVTEEGATIQVSTKDISSYVFIGPVTANTITKDSIACDALVGLSVPYNVATTHNQQFLMSNGTSITQFVDTANITAGSIDYYVFWRPISEDGSVTAA